MHCNTPARKPLSLVIGPPGTGKTKLAGKLCDYWYEQFGSVLAVAESHAAADQLFASISVRKCRWPDNSRDCVLVSTVTAAGRPDFPRSFTSCILDEAAFCTEPTAFIPLQAVIAKLERICLLGDHRQLRPCVLSQEPGLLISFFERLATEQYPRIQLSVQYRSHPSIMEFPSMFYDGAIRSADHLSFLPPVRGFKLDAHRVAFVPVVGDMQTYQFSAYNELEAEMVLEVARQMVDAGESSESIAIVTPYNAQKVILQRHTNIPVYTVDGLQGGERDIILFSAVRSGESPSLGFLEDDRRLNVMLTRAKRGLVVFGDPHALRTGETWSKWLDYIQSVWA
eukprot:GEMP01043055.1.p1 GENE.GEMP01043055.1~~GEMP01043055.1.p1  ORF type:complete len:339 (+),score=71.94 GEMP01043055.1:315-1331(+)